MDSDRGREPVVISVPSVQTPSHQFSIQDKCDLTLTTKFLNYSGRKLVMGWRSGALFDLPPRPDRHAQSFIVRQELSVSDNLKHALRERLLSLTGVVSPDMEQFRSRFMDGYRDQTFGTTLKYDHIIDPTQVVNDGGTVYVGELDIIVSTRQDHIPLHPFCLEALQRPSSSQRTNVENGLSAYIVDNKEMIGPRFIRLMGKVIRINTVRSSLQQDGMYVSYRGLIENPLANAHDFLEIIPSAEIDKTTWVFKSYAEAKNAPERDVEMGLEIKELDLQGRKLAAEATVTKTEYDQQKVLFERQNEALQRRHDEIDRQNRLYEQELQRRYAREDHESRIEQLRSKDFYDDRSSSRKDQSEWIKFFPTMLMGVGAAVMAMKSLF